MCVLTCEGSWLEKLILVLSDPLFIRSTANWPCIYGGEFTALKWPDYLARGKHSIHCTLAHCIVIDNIYAVVNLQPLSICQGMYIHMPLLKMPSCANVGVRGAIVYEYVSSHYVSVFQNECCIH